MSLALNEIDMYDMFNDVDSEGIIKAGDKIVGFKEKNIIYINTDFYDLDFLVNILGRFLWAYFRKIGAKRYLSNKGKYKVTAGRFIVYFKVSNWEQNILDMYLWDKDKYTDEARSDYEGLKLYKEIEGLYKDGKLT